MDEMDDRTWEVVYQLAAIGDTSVRNVMDALEKICNPETIQVQNFDNIVTKMQDLPRSPAEIKKDIKHEKNPMRLKQLNKELNESYKHLRIADAMHGTKDKR